MGVVLPPRIKDELAKSLFMFIKQYSYKEYTDEEMTNIYYGKEDIFENYKKAYPYYESNIEYIRHYLIFKFKMNKSYVEINKNGFTHFTYSGCVIKDVILPKRDINNSNQVNKDDNDIELLDETFYTKVRQYESNCKCHNILKIYNDILDIFKECEAKCFYNGEMHDEVMRYDIVFKLPTGTYHVKYDDAYKEVSTLQPLHCKGE